MIVTDTTGLRVAVTLVSFEGMVKMPEPKKPIDNCECGCNDSPIEQIKRQIACYEAAESLTQEEQGSLLEAKQLLEVIEQLAKQGEPVSDWLKE